MHQYKIFIAGSIGIKNIDDAVVERIKNIVDQQYQIMVGDANGVDSLIQHILKDMQTGDVTVYCASKQPRNNLGNWFVKTIESKEKPGTRAFFTAKDIKMAENCDYGLMVWDAKSTGTLKNVIELLKRNKISLIYLHPAKKFLKIKTISDLKNLLSYMDEKDISKANAKFNLKHQIDILDGLKNQQTTFL